MFRKVITVILAALMLISLAACGPGSSEASDSKSETSDKYPSGFIFDEESFKGQTLQWWNHWNTEDTKGYIKEFEDATGATIEYGFLSGGGGIEYYLQLNAALASGTGPDIAVVYDWAVPTWCMKKLLLPITDVLDVSEDIYKEKINNSMLDFFSYDGKPYVVATNDVSCYYIIYRRDLIDEAGLRDPYEVWLEGGWDYETFNEYLEALTYDSDSDGVIDMAGFTGYTDEGWLGTVENGNYVRWEEDGHPRYALTDADLVEAFTEGHLINSKNWQRQVQMPIDEFLSGKIAMFYSAQWDWAKPIEAFGIDNIGWVQMPYAPSNTSKVVLNRTNASGYAFTNNLDVPELAEHYIKYSMFWDRIDVDYEEEKQKTIAETFGGSEDFYNFHTEMQKLTFAPNAGSFGNLLDIIQGQVLWNYADSVATLAQSAQPAAQSIIDDIFYAE